jgi:hypothetical protein
METSYQAVYHSSSHELSISAGQLCDIIELNPEVSFRDYSCSNKFSLLCSNLTNRLRPSSKLSENLLFFVQDDVDDVNEEDARLVIDPHNVEASFAFQVTRSCRDL